MSLTPGARLGAYEVVALLGAGGMGEVYKARDTRLDRTVAIKVLPAALADDSQLRERLDREARAVSALDHPNICVLYDVGEAPNPIPEPGSPKPSLIRFLVMQYLEGETLESRLKKGALPLDEAVDYATQIADALDRAHRAGFVHRDLKPGNVMLTKAGAKLLDFGLAKSSVAPGAAAGLSMLPTTPPNLTVQGAILGTLQYMAPEQLEGRDSDARTDIFAFGAVLYEMVTGRKAFEGRSQADLMGAIMRGDPVPLPAILPAAPALLWPTIRACLAKDPDDRIQSAHDLVLQLRWAAERASDTGTPPTDRSRGQRERTRHLALLAAIIVAAGTLAVAAVLALRNRPASDLRPIRFTVSPPRNVALATGASIGQAVPAVSPDGRYLAFIATRAGTSLLWLRAADSLEVRPMAGTDGATLPFWSPDSRQIGFFAQGRVKTIDVTSGQISDVCETPGNPGGGAWGRDGVIVLGSGPGREAGLFTVSARGGSPKALTRPDPARGERSHRFPSFLPDGRRFLYRSSPRLGGWSDKESVWIGSLDGNTPQRLLENADQPVYVAPGLLLFGRGTTLLVQAFDERQMTATGDAFPIAGQVLRDATTGALSFAASSGVLAYRASVLAGATQLTWVDRAGRSLGSLGDAGRYRNPVLSPDGTRVAVERADPQSGRTDIWLVDASTGRASRFTFDPGDEANPNWSPDSQAILFGSARSGALNLYRKRTDGGGGEEPVTESRTDMFPLSWAPDGRSVVFRTIQDGFTGIGVLPLVGERTPHLYRSSSTFAVSQAQVSPDGKWLTYISGESGQYEAYIESFPNPGSGKRQISRNGGLFPRWRRDGRELFYLAFDGWLMAAPTASTASLEAGAPVALFEAHVLNGANILAGLIQQYDAARDGQRFLLNMPLEDADAAINVVLNWQEELKQRVPTR